MFHALWNKGKSDEGSGWSPAPLLRLRGRTSREGIASPKRRRSGARPFPGRYARSYGQRAAGAIRLRELPPPLRYAAYAAGALFVFYTAAGIGAVASMGLRELPPQWVSVFLLGLFLGLSVAILVVLSRVWGTTDRTEQQDRGERLEMMSEQKERLEYLTEEHRILLEELERLREQKERLQRLREDRAGLLAELKRLRLRVEEEKKRASALPSAPAEQSPGATIRYPHNRHAAAKGSVPSAGGAETAEGPQAGGERRSWWRRMFGR
jgi:hypothetical protein